MLSKTEQFSKRCFDMIVAFLLLPFVIFPLILLLIIATMDTRRNGLFVQDRVGKDGALFKLFKIRTLKGGCHQSIHDIKANETKVGRWLRTTKLDELPQVFNVLLGSMSWVGPRPDVKGYADELKGQDRLVLSVRPGVTGVATLKYKNEESILLGQDDPNLYNDTVIWPDKVQINRKYIQDWSLREDVKILCSTIF